MRVRPTFLFAFLLALFIAAAASPLRAQTRHGELNLSSDWRLQPAPLVSAVGQAISGLAFSAAAWHPAIVPGTVLTSLVADHTYPEPLYGENSRTIPESLARQDYWYRTTILVPRAFVGRHIFLNFDGINYAAQVWVNGSSVGTLRGAFIRGTFDISAVVRPGRRAAIAVLISPQPHPGQAHEHDFAHGVGQNGGITALDGPTFLASIGWDWLQPIRDRETGIWQRVFLSASGPVRVEDPLVTSDLPLPDTSSADLAISARLENLSAATQRGTLRGSFAGVAFSRSVTLPPHASQLIALDPTNTPALHLLNPRLWWPAGYGAQNLYSLHLVFSPAQARARAPSDTLDLPFGIRKITYAVPGSPNLTISVNGVPIFIRGGNWGMDEGLKRIPRERLETLIRLHRLANLNMIRNWVGQSTSEDLYALADKYGILIWDEFFQPNPADGPDPADLPLYVANVRDKLLRFRNHPSIVLWCARNEGYPPPYVDEALRKLIAELDPVRLYQPNSADGRGVNSHGPYRWRPPQDFYTFDEAFKSEIGSMSVPTLESIQGMMPRKDWETINDDWAEHDFAKGNQGGATYRAELAARYGPPLNLADFTRKAQLANFEAFRAMYEARNAKLFAPTTGVITWMSNPAQPSFVWQIYHHDLEPNSSFFAVQSAGEPVHIQLNEATGHIEAIDNLPSAVPDATAHVDIYSLDGTLAASRDLPAALLANRAIDVGPVLGPALAEPTLPSTYFVRLQLLDANKAVLSRNFYWRAPPATPNDLTALDTMPKVALEVTATRALAAPHPEPDSAPATLHLDVTLHNPTPHIALMAHFQLHREGDSARILPVFYSSNYISLAPGETRTFTLEADLSLLGGAAPVILVDGWNITVPEVTSPIHVAPNLNADPAHWPTSNLPEQQIAAPPS